MKDRIGCITLSYDGVEGWYIPWKILTYDCKVKLDEILKNSRQVLANGKFDVNFMKQERKTLKVTPGYKLIKSGESVYKIHNNQEVLTERGVITGRELTKEDTIISFENLEKYISPDQT